MSLSFFLAKRIYGETKGGKQVSRPAVLIALTGIALGLAIMIVTVAVVIGFKREVANKVTGFGADIQITNFDALRSYETFPILVEDSLRQLLAEQPLVSRVQRYTTKPGIIKTDDAFQGMVLKGVGPEYDLSFFQSHLLEGEIPQFSDTVASNAVVISKPIADKMRLQLGDRVFAYFIQDNVRVRPLTIKGIYQTNFSEYDNLFLLTDIYTTHRLNNWQPGQVSGVEIRLTEYDRLEEAADNISSLVDNRIDKFGGNYFVQTIEELNPQIFEWLSLLDLNVIVILILMTGVAGFTMISGLLIIIIERTNMIGILKALGANNYSIRKVFLWFSVFLIGKGMLWGNAIGLLFCFVQSQFQLFELDPSNYYIESVPIGINIPVILLINVATLVVSVLMLIGPSFLITRIDPASSMRYE